MLLEAWVLAPDETITCITNLALKSAERTCSTVMMLGFEILQHKLTFGGIRLVCQTYIFTCAYSGGSTRYVSHVTDNLIIFINL